MPTNKQNTTAKSNAGMVDMDKMKKTIDELGNKVQYYTQTLQPKGVVKKNSDGTTTPVQADVTDSKQAEQVTNTISSQASAEAGHIQENSNASKSVNWNDPTAQEILKSSNDVSAKANYVNPNTGRFNNDTWMDQTGIDRDAIRTERERQQELARKRGIESAILQSFLIGSDLFGNAIGTFGAPGKYVSQRAKDTTGKEAREEMDKLRELQNAEDAAHGKMMMESEKAYANQAIQNMQAVMNAFGTSESNANKDSNQSGIKFGKESGKQSSVENRSKWGYDSPRYSAIKNELDKEVAAGRMTQERADAILNGAAEDITAPYLTGGK